MCHWISVLTVRLCLILKNSESDIRDSFSIQGYSVHISVNNGKD